MELTREAAAVIYEEGKLIPQKAKHITDGELLDIIKEAKDLTELRELFKKVAEKY